MIPKLLAFSDVMRKRGRDGRPRRRLCSNQWRTLYVSRRSHPMRSPLRKPLECRWRIDPKTGALSAVWFDPTNSAAQAHPRAGRDGRPKSTRQMPSASAPLAPAQGSGKPRRRSNPPGKSRAGSGRAMRQG